MAEVDRDPLVPILNRHVFKIMPFITAGVVHEYDRGSKPPLYLVYCDLQRGDIRQVASKVQRVVAAGTRDPAAEFIRSVFVDVEKSNA